MKIEKTIRIFIGSSINDLELERMKLMSFIQGLNNKYHERGIFIEGYICEETPNDMRAGGSQKLHDEFITDKADIAVFMFYTKAGEFTLKELELSRETFIEKGRPNIYVFFKTADDGSFADPAVQNVAARIFDEYGHYYKLFSDIETVQLDLTQAIREILPEIADNV
ncbi:MAG: hypothetical protein IKZ82_03390 [Clostridia bacterium]|nr:hypothetical protein [Clostridia bacterium]